MAAGGKVCLAPCLGRKDTLSPSELPIAGRSLAFAYGVSTSMNSTSSSSLWKPDPPKTPTVARRSIMETRDRLGVRRPQHPALGHDRRQEVGGRDVESGVPGSSPDRREISDFGLCALLHFDRAAVWGLEVDAAQRRDRIEGDAVLAAEQGERVSPDLVDDVSVGADPVGAGQRDVHPACLQETAGGGI